MPEFAVRPARATDAFMLALLLGSTQEPHFHSTAARLTTAIEGDPSRYLVAELEGKVVGSLSSWSPDFHPQHVWLGFHLHPDHRGPELAAALFQRASLNATTRGQTLAWTSVRADYLDSGPDLAALGFREVHRTFGGGFYLKDWMANTQRLELALGEAGIEIVPAATLHNDPRLLALYQVVRGDKVTAEPTIPAAGETLDDPDSLWDAGFVARRGAELLGLSLPERSGLGAWNAALMVHPQARRLGIGTALQARTCAALQHQEMTFLNTAGVKTDAAYLGVLRRLGANIEPDWIAFEAALP
jgi:GNAT superfamily N-acetyltransferase